MRSKKAKNDHEIGHTSRSDVNMLDICVFRLPLSFVSYLNNPLVSAYLDIRNGFLMKFCLRRHILLPISVLFYKKEIL